ncbi:MAG TPA: enoyl-CoA hydratase-related protein [Azospira sp.]|nr:enoyl-CoA hydratase-related protein [Azospira sp.]
MTGSILVARDGDIATVTLNNPDKLNAVNFAMWRDLATAMTELSADDSLRCVVLTGAGEAFAAGGDIEEFITQRATLALARNYHDQVGAALDAVRDCRHPTVALIRGACIGGGLEIAGNCDLRIAGEGAKFGAPINKLGFSMYPGEMCGLLALAGPAVMSEILLEGRILSAAEAHAKGLLTRVVADAQLADEAYAAARRIAAGAPLVARWHKQWMRRLLTGAPLTESEKDQSFAFLGTSDYQEGLNAFLGKRKPQFKGQ